MYASLGDDIAQEGDRGDMEVTLFSLHEKRVLQQSPLDGLDKLNVFLDLFGEDQDITQVGEVEMVEHVPWRWTTISHRNPPCFCFRLLQDPLDLVELSSLCLYVSI